MFAEAPHPDDVVTIHFQFTLGSQRVQARIPVPAGPTRVRTMLPVLQALDDRAVDQVIQEAAALGKTVSCKAGCGACCRQFIPITPTDAYHLRDLIEGLAEPRRTEIRRRFAAARQRLEEAGLLETMLHPESVDADRSALANAVFDLQIACPFLEDESCSIYADRPLLCREYLVTSPAVECGRPREGGVRRLPMPAPASRVLTPLPGDDAPPWVPILIAPEWADLHPEAPATEKGPDLLRHLFERWAKGASIPADPSAPDGR